MHRPNQTPILTRRSAVVALAASAIGPLETVWAKDSSVAALEARAPALPALGTRLQVPDIALLDGTPFHAAPGQPLLVYWWSSTCPFCAQQSPAMQALWQAQQARGLKMLALSIDKTAEEARTYLRRKGYSFPAAWASPEWRRSFAKPKGLPITLLLDRQQQLVLAEKGQMFDEDVQAIAGLL